MIENYNIDQYGIIHQVSSKPFIYNREYVDIRYSNLKLLTDEMAHLRLGYVIGGMGRIPKSVLDVGYGTGEFLKACTRIVNKCSGHDLFTDLLPRDCNFVNDITAQHYDVITFFDSLEHYPNIDFVNQLQCNYVVISVPWCHNFDDNWFKNWKHRRPDEHLHHFNLDSLEKFMISNKFFMISHSNMEDAIRKSPFSYPNILTAIFKKEHNHEQV